METRTITELNEERRARAGTPPVGRAVGLKPAWVGSITPEIPFHSLLCKCHVCARGRRQAAEAALEGTRTAD